MCTKSLQYNQCVDRGHYFAEADKANSHTLITSYMRKYIHSFGHHLRKMMYFPVVYTMDSHSTERSMTSQCKITFVALKCYLEVNLVLFREQLQV